MTGMEPTNSVKNIEWWCQTGVVFKVISDEWRKLSDKKKKTKQGLRYFLYMILKDLFTWKYYIKNNNKICQYNLHIII